MSEIINLSRRRVLKGTLAGGVILGLYIGGARMAFAASPLASASGVKRRTHTCDAIAACPQQRGAVLLYSSKGNDI